MLFEHCQWLLSGSGQKYFPVEIVLFWSGSRGKDHISGQLSRLNWPEDVHGKDPINEFKGKMGPGPHAGGCITQTALEGIFHILFNVYNSMYIYNQKWGKQGKKVSFV